MPLMRENDILNDLRGSFRQRVAGARRLAGPQCLAGPGFPAELIALDQVLTDRHAVRAFADTALARSLVLTVLALAYTEFDRAMPAAAGQLPVAVFTSEQAGYLADGRGQSVELPAVLPAGLLAEHYAPAPVHVAICGSVEWAASAEGPGYGGLLTAAGALGYGLWLGAASLGLAACTFGGALDEVTAVVTAGRPDLRHLFTVAIGKPRP
jgi:hypothetical protein